LIKSTLSQKLLLLNFLSQLIGFAALPILTRLYNVEDFGIFAVYSAFCQIVISSSCLRLELAIPNKDNEEDAIDILFSCILLSILSCILVIICITSIVFLTELNLLKINSSSYVYFEFIWIIPFTCLLGSIFNAFVFYAIRHERQTQIAKLRVIQVLVGSIVQVILGIILLGPIGLLIGYLLQVSIGMYSLGKPIFEELSKRFDKKLIRKLLQVVKDNKKYPLFSMPDSFFHMGSIQIPIILIGFININLSGYLFMANKILGVISTIVGNTFANLFSAGAPKNFKNNLLYEYTLSLWGQVTKAYLVMGSIIIIASILLLNPVFGDSWEPAIFLIIVLFLPLYLQTASSALGAVLYVTEKNNLALVVHCIGFFLKLFLIVLAVNPEIIKLEISYALGILFHYLLYLIIIVYTANKVNKPTPNV